MISTPRHRITGNAERRRQKVKAGSFSCALYFALCSRAKCSLPAALIIALCWGAAAAAHHEGPSNAARPRYRIDLALDFDARSFTGTERVRWTNRSDRPASVIYFHLYANKGTDAQRPAAAAAGDTEDEGSKDSRLEIAEVRLAATGQTLPFSLDDGATLLRVNLRAPLAANAATEIEIKFRGSVPEISGEETGLLAHVAQQINAVLRREREARRARDINFCSGNVMLLGTAYPVLAVRNGEDWQRKVENSVGDFVFAETADYEVSIDAPSDLQIFTSGDEIQSAARRGGRALRRFTGAKLRDFAITAGRGLRHEERLSGPLRVRSIFMPEHEKIGRRVLEVAAGAARTYSARFGPLPYRTINIAETPLPAGLGCTEFTSLGAIASAFYVDFDAPAMLAMPDFVREQRASVEDSLEFTVAHVVAHQWWGIVVGNDPERAPILDEALSNWSALLYYKDMYGEERAAGALDDQLRGVYKIYRTFGGEDMPADRDAHNYRNFFQYSAIVFSKGALMFAELRRLLGDEKFFAALRSYYSANRHEIAEMDDLRGALIAEAPLAQRRAVPRLFNRWLSEKHGDEDIAPPDPQLAAALGITIETSQAKTGDRNAFARLGKFFWRQMTRIR
jgi:hypothetical protein